MIGKRTIYLICFAFLLLIFGCIQEQVDTYKSNSLSVNPEAKYSLVFTDTVEFETDEELIWILDRNEKFFFGINNRQTKAYLFNSDGTIKTILDQQGEGPKEYTTIKKATLTPSGNIVVLTRSKAFLYNKEGVYLTSCDKLSNKFITIGAPYATALNDSIVYFSSVHPEHIQTGIDYFNNSENFTTTELNLFTCESSNFAPYESSSIYTQKFLPLGTLKMYALNQKSNNLITIYPYDKGVFIYNTSDRKLNRIINLNPKFFGLIEGAKNGDKGVDRQTYLYQKNAKYTKIKVSEDNKILLKYRVGRNEDQIFASLAKLNSSEIRPKSYYELYDLLSGEKIAEDILNPSDDLILFSFVDINNILFFTNKLGNNELEDKGHILRAKLEKD